MSLESFPKKNPGDSLAAKQVNMLSESARRLGAMVPGSFLNGQQGGTFIANSPAPYWLQSSVEISSKTIDDDDTETSGLYLCKLRYFDRGTTEWKSQSYEWRLDANVLDAIYEVGDLVTAYWYAQRAMFLPIEPEAGSHCTANPLIDARGTNSSTVTEETGETGSEVEFWLERKGESVNWTKILDRSFWINAYHEDSDVTVSGVGFVTWLANDDEVVRLALRASEALGDVSVEYGAIRLEAIAPSGIEATDSVAPDATYIENLVFEAEVNNADGVVRWPKFTIEEDNTDRIKIELPGTDSWTIKAEFTITITVTLGSASSISSSSISTSSISTSSKSSESMSSSSISTSSTSESSESSSTSTTV